MKLLYLIPALNNPGGMERILTQKINYLVEVFSFQITIITTDQMNAPIYFDLNKKVEIIHLNLDFNQHFNKNIFQKIVGTKKLLNQYKSILENFLAVQKIDICISLGGKELEFFYKIKTSTKKICELHFGQNVRQQFLEARSSNLFWKLVGIYRTNRLIKQTKLLDKLVVLTKADLAQWQKTNKNVVQIYNFSPFKSYEKSTLDKKRIISVGRLEPQKGFDLLIKAFSKVNKEDLKGYTFHIYGDGQDKEALLKLISNYKLNNFIFLKGISKNIQEEMYNSSMYIMTSRYEGFPMVLLEALSVGLPIISYNCPTGPAEIIENNDCGFLVEFNNTEQLVERTIELINKERLRIEKGEFAYNKNKKFDKVAIMKQWIDLFNDTISKN